MDDWSDAMIVAVVPGMVEVAKRAGLPVRWSGMAAMVAATVLIALRDLGQGQPVDGARIAALAASWLLQGIVLGLAAAGLYSQARLRRGPGERDPNDSAKTVDQI
jgi:NaMN:DMB phosphoribosyltransferase